MMMFLHFCNFWNIASCEEAVSKFSDQAKVVLLIKIKIVNYWSAAKIIQVSSFMSYNFFFVKSKILYIWKCIAEYSGKLIPN